MTTPQEVEWTPELQAELDSLESTVGSKNTLPEAPAAPSPSRAERTHAPEDGPAGRSSYVQAIAEGTENLRPMRPEDEPAPFTL